MDHQKSKSTFNVILLSLTLMVAALGVGLAIAAEKKGCVPLNLSRIRPN